VVEVPSGSGETFDEIWQLASMESVSASTNSNRVGIVTVSFRSRDAILELLASIPGAATCPVEVIVVDNVPGGDAELAASLEGTTARIVSRPDNPGYGGGVNAGVAALRADTNWVFVVNPDVTLDAGVVDELIRVGLTDPAIGSLGPRIRDTDGEIYPSARAIPSLRLGVGHALLGDLAPTNPWTRRYHQFSDYDTQRDAGWLSGACVLIRREAFDSIGGFDDDFFMYFEDVDLGYRLARNGWRNVFVPSATVEHEGGHSTRNHSTAMIQAHHASARRWIGKRYSGPAWLPVRVVVVAGLRLRQVLVSRR
jgi:N-acetylglucosaminyl-diphospho-decaprenol L-rhamnosyltransferase